MGSYIIRRLILIVPTLVLVTITVFMLIRLVPGDVLDLMVAQWGGQSGVPQEQRTLDELKHKLGMDAPIHVQYVRWVGNVFKGNLGTSLWSERPVTKLITDRLTISVELGFFAIILALLLAVPIGIYSAVRQDTALDYLGRSFAILCISLPSFWLGTMVVVYPSIWWGWSPPVQYVKFLENPLANLGQFLLPAFIMGMVMSGTVMRMVRTMMLEVLRQDYIRTAWSKGLRERTVVFRHAMKNAMIPVVTIVGMMVPVMIGGSVIMEQIFTLPGVGLLYYDAIQTRDYPIVSGVNLILAGTVMLVNLITDMSYGWLDPRIRYQ